MNNLMNKFRRVPEKRGNLPYKTWLVCLVLLSSIFIVGTMARYTGRDAGTDSTRTAGFDVEVTGLDYTGQDLLRDVSDSSNSNEQAFYSVTGYQDGYQFTVTNKSEVAVRCTIQAKSQIGYDVPAFELQTSDGKVLEDGVIDLGQGASYTVELILYANKSAAGHQNQQPTVEKMDLGFYLEQID